MIHRRFRCNVYARYVFFNMRTSGRTYNLWGKYKLMDSLGLRKFLKLYADVLVEDVECLGCYVSDLAFNFHVFQHEDVEIQN